MINYNVVFEECEKYSAIIYSLSYDNPIHDIQIISEELNKTISKSCYILFDLLLSNGENFNRFVEGYFDGAKISFDSLSVIDLPTETNLSRINSFYRKNPSVLNNGVLTNSQKLKYIR